MKKPAKVGNGNVKKEEDAHGRRVTFQGNCSLGFLIATLIVSIAHLGFLIFVSILLMGIDMDNEQTTTKDTSAATATQLSDIR